MSRLPQLPGERIERGTGLEFEFEGRRVQAYRGDTISSALTASGVRVLGRSFKYHRPRGLLSAAGHDVNALMQVRTSDRSIPNVRADVVQVEPDWQVRAVNTRGGLAHDRLALLGHLGPFLPVGFYYKAFHSKRLFPRWERMFRQLAGLGTVDLSAARRITAKRYDSCDVLVIGAGPSGLAAALSAAGRGASVMLVDENPAVGGSGLYARGGIASGAEQTLALIAAVNAHPRVRVLTHTFAAGYYADNWVALIAPQYMLKVRAGSVIVAQGAYEQPAVFRGNDLPGVMLASGAQRLLYHYAVTAARRIAVLTANAEGYASALDALAHGLEVLAILDLRPQPGAASQAARATLGERAIPVYTGIQQLEARAGPGDELASVRFEWDAGAGPGRQRIELDGIWMSVGFAPANALLHQAGTLFSYSHRVEQFVPRTLPAGVYACGKVNGVYSLDERIVDGRDAGAQAAGRLGFGAATARRVPAAAAECPTHPYPIFAHKNGLEFIDFDEDLHLRDLQNACQEGFDSSELLKRFSTLGMGPSQGKHSGMNALRVLAAIRGKPIGELGTTTARPMFHPVPLAHLAGRGFSPERRTPLDSEHESSGAVWMAAGNWRRPEYYAQSGQTREAAIAAEVNAVRTRCGLIDVGTLGKIELRGTNATELLERVYTTRFANLKIGMTRYGIMLDEAGIVIDDGVIARLGPETFYFTTTTGNSAAVFRELGRLATWWELPVGLVNLTGHYAAFNLAGPCSRELLREHTAIDLADEAFPYLAVREGPIAGVPCRIMRVGFVGELGYEIHLPAERALDLWRLLLASGERFHIRPFGVEAQRMLRLEKGHLIVGQDTDGVTNALEIDAPWALKMDKPFFIGQRSLSILAKQPRRQTLVGFQLPVEEVRRPKEGHLIIADGQIAGRVTSVGRSPTLGRCIGLALVSPAQAAGKSLRIRIEQRAELEAQVVRPPFYDPHGERQRISAPQAAGPAAKPAPERERVSAPAACRARLPLESWFRTARPAGAAPAGAVLSFEVHGRRARFGCKGPGGAEWLESCGFRVPTAPNSALLSAGVLVARLATSEFLIEALSGGAEQLTAAERQLTSAAAAKAVYPVAHQDLVLTLQGSALQRLLRQICSYDFAALLANPSDTESPVVLASMIGVGVVAWAHRTAGGAAALTLWLDPSFAHYFWTTLLEVAHDLGDVHINESGGAPE